VLVLLRGLPGGPAERAEVSISKSHGLALCVCHLGMSVLFAKAGYPDYNSTLHHSIVTYGNQNLCSMQFDSAPSCLKQALRVE
jgi:hypothetical protein